MKTKAQSQVISTVLLILIVLVAVAVIWTIIRPFFDKVETDRAKCIEVRLEINKALSTTDTITIERKAGGDEGDVTGFKILINGQLATIDSVDGVACAGDACDTSLERLKKKQVHVTTDFTQGAEIQIAPMVGEQKELCTPSATAIAS